MHISLDNTHQPGQYRVLVRGRLASHCVEACEGKDGHIPFVMCRELSVSVPTLTTGTIYTRQYINGEVEIIKLR